MATAAQVASGAASFQGLSDKLDCIIYLLNTNSMTAAQIADGAKTFQGLVDKLGAIVYLLASGGASGGSMFYVITTGTTPTQTPAGAATAYDSSNGTLWAWDGATWQKIIA